MPVDRLRVATPCGTCPVGRTVAGTRPVAGRPVARLTPPTPPRRPPEPDHGPSHSDVLRLWEDLEWWSCAYCDRDFGLKVVCQVDHVIPLAKGGLHILANLAPACGECNRAKSDRDIDDWLAIIAGQLVTDG